MTVETATYISDLNATYPSATDPKSEGDNHLRLIKSTIKTTFPNVAGAVSATHTQLSYVTGVTSAIQTQLDGKLNLSGGTMTGKLNANGGIDATTDLTLGCGYTYEGITLSSSGGHTINGTSLTAKVSTLSVFTDPSITSAANVAITPFSITATPINITDTSDLTIRGAYSASAPVTEGTVTVPSRLVAQSDVYSTGTGKRFVADFTNATVSNRFMFQTSTANGSTLLRVIPNGTSTTASLQVGNSSAPDNSSVCGITVDNTSISFNSQVNGTGTYLPMVWSTNGSNRLNLANDGTFTSISGGIGYGIGAGGTVTQITSRTTGVTLNKPSGEITLVSAAGSTSWQSFTLTNSTIASGDSVHLCQVSGTDKYLFHVTNINAGSCQITFATTGGTTTEQPGFRFTVLKGART